MKHAIRMRAVIAIFVVSCFALGVSAQETVLHSFNDNDGNEPISGLIFDSSGNLYGTTFYGGTDGVGTVYKLTHKAGGWSEKVLYSFLINGVDGYQTTAGVALDAAGNIYGVTEFGGPTDYGTVFELTRSSGGAYTETILHTFNHDGTDGTYPQSGVTIDASGNLYGTTPGGGTNGYGTVYELSPAAGGGWTEKILYSFNATDGANPFGGLIFDSKGNLYGATSAGGGTSAHCSYGCGTVFELSRSAGGGWTEKVLHNFTNNTMDGIFPYSGLVFDASGNLYGTASQGGAHGNSGTVFELMPIAGGLWREKILHSFTNNGTDGSDIMSTPVFDAAGNLYGTTLTGGANHQGTVFELTPTANGYWTEKILFTFDSTGTGAFDPVHGLVFDGSGNLYGTTLGGGTNADGTVFEITP